MTTIFVKRFDDGHGIKLSSADPLAFKAAIDALKSIVPVPLRRYDPTTKQWTVVESATERLHRWLAYCRTNLRAEIQWLDADAGEQHEEERTWTPPPPRQQPKLSEAYATLFLLPQAPPEVVKASYRALAQKHHPDHQGDNTTMQRLNEAYQLLSKQVAA